MVMKQPEVTERTRKRMCRAFWHLYAKQPLDRITVKQIAELAGYNRATFYQYYSGVRDLLDQEEDRLIAERHQAMNDRIIDMRGTDDIRINLTLFLEQTRKDAPYIALLIGPNGDRKFIDKLRDVASPLIRPIIAGNDSDNTQPTGKTGEYLTEFYLGGMLTMMRAWLADPDPMPLAQMVELVIDTFMPGVTAE
ncbi:TetR family transcriptional regulator [Bifidobacterium margollesii]|uniref:TetR family transcriptional regulator n=1 Tax=Bifidobacterium margollesii TaxID=2020964 RepID=A0A2N5J8W9_9BIFI|nr:TetR/AcrR family transcriptional regulator [Bifidobacterium margollesii]PLS30631.1 TetR family transcriptional regulator [Bifidobacterium margollesii]